MDRRRSDFSSPTAEEWLEKEYLGSALGSGAGWMEDGSACPSEVLEEDGNSESLGKTGKMMSSSNISKYPSAARTREISEKRQSHLSSGTPREIPEA